MTCADCRHSAPKADRSPLLLCRRYPPAVLAPAGEAMCAAWPLVDPDAVCGEHEPKRRARVLPWDR